MPAFQPTTSKGSPAAVRQTAKSSPLAATKSNSRKQRNGSQQKSTKTMHSSPDRPEVTRTKHSSSERPAVTRARTTGGKSVSRTRSMSRETSVKGQDDRIKDVLKVPEITSSGLKIINWSGQGMTSIPLHLLTAKDIGHLVLASNNLRSVTTDILRLKHLEKLDLSKNSIKCSSPADFSGLPRELSLLTRLTELSLSECNLPFVPPAIFVMSRLRVLDISRNRINTVPAEIGQLVNLVTLKLNQTGITSLPAEIAGCQQLEQLFLWGNKMRTLPDSLSRLPALSLLAINYRSFSGGLDPNMDNKLKQGQLTSEHIPGVVFELSALEALDLEGTKLNTTPEIHTSQLQELSLAHNYIQTIPPSIFKLKQLRVLDLTKNLISCLPDDISQLTKLHILRMSTNHLEVIPATIGDLSQLQELDLSGNKILSIPPGIKGLRVLKMLNLARNRIDALPNELCELSQLQTLDITSNYIRALPGAIYQLTKLATAHSFYKLVKSGLWLSGNPLQQPPVEVWQTDQPENIFNYFRKQVIFQTEHLQRQKLQFLGNSQSGKTSLVRALTLKKSLLTRGEIDRTSLLDQTKWETENSIDFLINDFGGYDAYRMLHKMFLDPKSLTILTYNAAELNRGNFQDTIGFWLDLLSAATPGAVVKIVGTHVDVLVQGIEMCGDTVAQLGQSTPQENQNVQCTEEPCVSNENCQISADSEFREDSNIRIGLSVQDTHKDKLNELINRYLTTREERLQDELNITELEINQCTPATTKEMNARLERLLTQKRRLKEIQQEPLKLLPEISLVSAGQDLEGIPQLVNELEHLAINQTLFPGACRQVPAQWQELQVKIKQQTSFWLDWEDVQQVAHKLNMKHSQIHECLQHLHDIGEIVWLGKVPQQCQVIFHKPKKMVKIIASLYRHDLGEFLTYDNKVFFSKGRLSLEQFDECSRSFLLRGELSRPMLDCFWFSHQFKNPETQQLLNLLPLIAICYTVPEPDIPSGHLTTRPVMVIPRFNTDSDTTVLQEIWSWSTKYEDTALVSEYSFPLSRPEDILFNVSCQLQNLADARLDCRDKIYLTFDNQHVLIQYSKTHKNASLNICVRGPELYETQKLMDDIVQTVNKQLIQYPGLYWRLTVQDRSLPHEEIL